MHIKSTICFLERIIKFAKDNDIVDSEYQGNKLFVVTFKALENYLKEFLEKDYKKVVEEFDDLYSFLMVQGLCISGREWKTEWSYRIIHGSKYIHIHHFPPLKSDFFHTYNLFVLYQDPELVSYDPETQEMYEAIEKKLSKEINICYNHVRELFSRTILYLLISPYINISRLILYQKIITKF